MSSIESRVMKAGAIRGGGAKVAFNFDDLEARLGAHVEQVRAETRRMIEDAEKEADAVRLAAQKMGFEAGRQAGLGIAQEEITRRVEALANRLVDERLSTVLPALKQASELLASERDRWLAEWETAAVRLSVAIAEKVVRHELAVRPEVGTSIVTGALELVSGAARIAIRMNPADLELFGEYIERASGALASCGEAKFVPDESVSRGGCVIESQHGTIDAQVETQLERIMAELLQAE
jgi:flagellar assembly protein FliH